MYRWIDNSVRLNVNDMFDEALRNARIEMSRAERRQFFDKYIRCLLYTSLHFGKDGSQLICSFRPPFSVKSNTEFGDQQ